MPGFSDQPRASLAAEGEQTRSFWGCTRFLLFSPPLQTSPKPGTVMGWGHHALRDPPGPAVGPRNPVSVLEHHHGPEPRSLGSACSLFGGSQPGNGARPGWGHQRSGGRTRFRGKRRKRVGCRVRKASMKEKTELHMGSGF